MIYRYRGRDFTEKEINLIRELIVHHKESSRRKLSKAICERLDWRKVNGELKDMACRVALLMMDKDKLISLPPKKFIFYGKSQPQRVNCDPLPPIDLPVHQIGTIEIQLVKKPKESILWNSYIDRYHYLGYKPLPGAQLRYLIKANNQLVALIGFGGAAWRVAPRDAFIGWADEKRKSNLHLIINNARFLILPWVTSQNLASKILSLIAKKLPTDWEQRYKYRPVLFETFVEDQKFKGACYKASNWVMVGKTQGRGKMDRKHQNLLPIKSIWLFPLSKKFKKILCS